MDRGQGCKHKCTPFAAVAEVFTPHMVVSNTTTPWLYANRVFAMPAGIPAVQFRHRYSVANPATGTLLTDNAFFRRLPNANATNWTVLVPMGAAWRYSTNAPPSQWAAPGFNADSWPQGTAKFGAGSGPKNLVTRLAQRKSAYYFRREFVMNFPEAQELLLEATCTDAYAGNVPSLRVFLNGEELTTTGIEAVTDQGNELRYYDLHAVHVPAARRRQYHWCDSAEYVGRRFRRCGLRHWPQSHSHTRQAPRS
jgi:hypothetical protein